MPTKRETDMRVPDYLRRARLALRVLSGSGLGDLSWVGPNGICTLGEIDREGLEFLLKRIRQDYRLLHDVRHCRSQGHLRSLQETAISRALEEYAMMGDGPRPGRTDVNRGVSGFSTRH